MHIKIGIQMLTAIKVLNVMLFSLEHIGTGFNSWLLQKKKRMAVVLPYYVNLYNLADNFDKTLNSSCPVIGAHPADASGLLPEEMTSDLVTHVSRTSNLSGHVPGIPHDQKPWKPDKTVRRGFLTFIGMYI